MLEEVPGWGPASGRRVVGREGGGALREGRPLGVGV